MTLVPRSPSDEETSGKQEKKCKNNSNVRPNNRHMVCLPSDVKAEEDEGMWLTRKEVGSGI